VEVLADIQLKNPASGTTGAEGDGPSNALVEDDGVAAVGEGDLGSQRAGTKAQFLVTVSVLGTSRPSRTSSLGRKLVVGLRAGLPAV
jgi:hypothetical protein